MDKEEKLSNENLKKVVAGTKIDYSQYSDYPEIQTCDLVLDPYEGDYISSTLLNWRVKCRGFRKNPEEKNK